MRTRALGNSGIQATVIALGAWAIGGGPWWGATDDALSIQAIHAALDAGVNCIDTAPVYGFGHSEEVVGQAIKGRRDKVVLATKCGLWWADERGSEVFQMSGNVVRRCLRPETLRIEIEDSLRRMNTDYIDLYQTHRQVQPQDPTSIEDIMACLLDLKAQGKIRAIGASNTTTADVDRYLAAGELACVQERYSMLDRKLETEALPQCLDKNVAVLAYSPLEQGLLTGAISRTQVFAEGERRNTQPWLQPNNRSRVLDMLDGWQDLTETYDCTLAQLVIAWTVAQPGITVTLCGARKPAHAESNTKAAALNIAPADATRIRADVQALGNPI